MARRSCREGGGCSPVARLIGREGSSQQKASHNCTLQSAHRQTRLGVELDGKEIAIFVCDLNVIIYLCFICFIFFLFHPDTKESYCIWKHIIHFFWILTCKKMDEIRSSTWLLRVFTLTFVYCTFVILTTEGILLAPRSEIDGIWTPALPFAMTLGKFLISRNLSFASLMWG